MNIDVEHLTDESLKELVNLEAKQLGLIKLGMRNLHERNERSSLMLDTHLDPNCCYLVAGSNVYKALRIIADLMKTEAAKGTADHAIERASKG